MMPDQFALTAGQVAQALGYSYDYFRKEVRYWDAFPAPLNVPGRERWHPQDVREWVDSRRKAA